LTNIFREAQQLLDTKADQAWSEEEWVVFGAAMIPLDRQAKYNDMTTREGLEVLARMFEENEDAEGGPEPRRHLRRLP